MTRMGLVMERTADPTFARGARLTAGAAMLAAILLLGLAAAPDRASAQSVCVPNGDGTYTPTPGPGPGPPGSIEIGPGESCPTTTPEPPVPAAELPPEPECPECPDEDKRKTKAASASGGDDSGGYVGEPASDTAAGGDVEQLPFTGSDDIRFALLLGGLGLIALGLGFAVRRRISHDW